MMTSGELRSRLEAGVPVAVWGIGKSGTAAVDWLAARGIPARAFDQRGDASYPRRSDQFPVVVTSPGFDVRHPWQGAARTAGAIVISELDLASLWFPGRILAVTGTNGKTTLCQLLSDALRRIGLSGPPCGNIGLPFCQWLHDHRDRDWAVVEVSSFQAAQSMVWRPSAVIWTSFAEDHLEIHGDLHTYFRAKLRLLERLLPGGGAWIAPEVGQWAAELEVALPPPCQVPPPGEVSKPGGGPFQEEPFLGNYQLARGWFLQNGWPESVLLEAAREGAFAPHRLQTVGVWNGVTYVDDSKATNFSAVKVALRRFAGRRIHWIGGGKDKGSDLHGLAAILAPGIRHAWVLGETGPGLARALEDRSGAATPCSTLEEAVEGAAGMARRGDVVLLSPGFSSLDQFVDYRDRGRSFQKAVLALNTDEAADLVES